MDEVEKAAATAGGGDGQEASDVWRRGNIVRREHSTRSETDSPAELQKEPTGSESPPPAKERRQPRTRRPSGGEVRSSGKNDLPTAASLRVKAGKFRPREIEVRWEEHENAPNLWFLTAAILLILCAGVLFYLAMYLR